MPSSSKGTARATAELQKAVDAQQQALAPLLELPQNKYKDAAKVIERMASLSNTVASSTEKLCAAIEQDELFAVADATVSDQAVRESLEKVHKVLSTPSSTPRITPATREMELARQIATLQGQLLEAKAVSGDQLAVREEALRHAQDAAQRQRCELEDEAVRMKAALVTTKRAAMLFVVRVLFVLHVRSPNPHALAHVSVWF